MSECTIETKAIEVLLENTKRKAVIVEAVGLRRETIIDTIKKAGLNVLKGVRLFQSLHLTLFELRIYTTLMSLINEYEHKIYNYS
ncbi:hypothetical protein ACFL3C_01370 [Patescibacteria group bacterium]